jgi:hypothetical protein
MVGDAVRDKDAVAANFINMCCASKSERKHRLQRVTTTVCRKWILQKNS